MNFAVSSLAVSSHPPSRTLLTYFFRRVPWWTETRAANKAGPCPRINHVAHTTPGSYHSFSRHCLHRRQLHSISVQLAGIRRQQSTSRLHRNPTSIRPYLKRGSSGNYDEGRRSRGDPTLETRARVKMKPRGTQKSEAGRGNPRYGRHFVYLGG